jgi:sulfite exporter TauE/SafE
MGLFGGAHCVAMCGGLVGIACASPCGAARRRRLPYWLAYNAGRIASYTAIGVVLGSIGGIAGGSLPLDMLRYCLRAFAAVSMLAVGLHLTGLPSMISGVTKLGARLWRCAEPLAQRLLPLRTPLHALALGSIWGLMPCGLLYGAMALSASADTAAEGALTMAAFGLGTLPVMLTMSALAQSVARWLARAWVRRAAGVVVLGLGLVATTGLVRQATSPSHHCCPTR